MNKNLRTKLFNLAKNKITNSDPSHDFEHALRVLANAQRIAKEEKADLDIIIPAALFHDIINYPKHSPMAKYASDKSAEVTRKILKKIKEYPQDKIDKVYTAIKQCSFSKAIVPDFLEAKILQDADGLEATGAISIMRTFSSTGQYKRPFYNQKDPFCKNRQPDSSHFALDLFYTRLLVVKDRMHTKSAKKIALKRTAFLKKFLDQLKNELAGK
ncbi:MAG: HD domain-containing protein [Patescibacteria group bacterium]